MNCTYYRISSTNYAQALNNSTVLEKNVKTLLLLVHGFSSSPDTFSDISALINSDEELVKKYDIKYFAYSTGVHNRNSPKVAAENLSTIINYKYRNYNKIVIMAHSLGGLIARQYIVNEFLDGRRTKVTKIINFASPHLGAQMAKTFNFLGNNHLKSLAPDSEYIRDLLKNWQKVVATRAIETINLVADEDNIVSRLSAEGANWFDRSIPIEFTDHSTIVRPQSAETMSYIVLRSILLEDVYRTDVALKEDATHFFRMLVPSIDASKSMADELVDAFRRKSFYLEYNCALTFRLPESGSNDCYDLYMHQNFTVWIGADSHFTIAVVEKFESYDRVNEFDFPYEMIFAHAGNFDAKRDISASFQNNGRYLPLPLDEIEGVDLQNLLLSYGVSVDELLSVPDLRVFQGRFPLEIDETKNPEERTSRRLKVELISRDQRLSQGSCSWIADCATQLQSLSFDWGSIAHLVENVRLNAFLPAKASWSNEQLSPPNQKVMELHHWVRRGHGVALLWRPH